MKTAACFAFAVGTAISFSFLARAEQPAAEAPSKTKIAFAREVERETEIEFKGHFAAAQAHEVALKTKAWTTLVVDEAVPHGTAVKKGQLVLKFETKKIDKLIASTKYDLEVSEQSLKSSEVSLAVMRESVPKDLAMAREAKKRAVDDLEYFVKTSRARRELSAKRSLKSATFQLEYAEEELNQLTKMYKADDLTEETEEIILKRAKRSVESSKYFLESARIRTERTLKTLIPRDFQDLTDAARKAIDVAKKAEVDLPAGLKKKEIAVAKAKVDHKQLEEKLDQLQNDRKMLAVKAPFDGIVFYGKFTRGKWAGKTLVSAALKPGAPAKAKMVLMTVVKTGGLKVQADVPEKDLRYAKAGANVSIKATAFPDDKIISAIASVTPVPLSPGSFGITANVDETDIPIVAGMACTATLKTKRKVLEVPAAAVTKDGEKSVVSVIKGGVVEKRTVSTGKTKAGKIEITKGLKAGESVVLPAKKKTSGAPKS